MTQIVVRRVKAWQDRARKYEIRIDGEPTEHVAHGSEAWVPVAPGRHRVQLKIDWCWSPELDVEVADGDIKPLLCGPSANAFTALLYITLWRKRYLWLREEARSLLPEARAQVRRLASDEPITGGSGSAPSSASASSRGGLRA